MKRARNGVSPAIKNQLPISTRSWDEVYKSWLPYIGKVCSNCCYQSFLYDADDLSQELAVVLHIVYTRYGHLKEGDFRGLYTRCISNRLASIFRSPKIKGEKKCIQMGMVSRGSKEHSGPELDEAEFIMAESKDFDYDGAVKDILKVLSPNSQEIVKEAIKQGGERDKAGMREVLRELSNVDSE